MKTKWIQWILVYVLWIITAGLGFLCVISARNLSLSIFYLFSVSRWVAPAVDKIIFLILGVLWLVLVIFAEYYYREAVAKNILWKRSCLITAIQLFCLSGSHFIPVLIVSKTSVYGTSLLLPATELIGGIIFFAQYRFRRRGDRIV